MKLENEKLYVKHQSGEGATLGSALLLLELKRKLLENSCLENFIQHKEKLEGGKKADLALALEVPLKRVRKRGLYALLKTLSFACIVDHPLTMYIYCKRSSVR